MQITLSLFNDIPLHSRASIASFPIQYREYEYDGGIEYWKWKLIVTRGYSVDVYWVITRPNTGS